MTYKSILTFPTDPDKSTAALDFASLIAENQDGHLEAFCLGIDRTQAGYYYAGANALIQQEAFDRARTDAKEAEDWVNKRLTGSTFTWAADKAVVVYPGLSNLISLHARFADVVVLAKPYGENRDSTHEAILEAALFEGHAPIIVVPDEAKPAYPPERVIIAWNESPEALNAVRAALPLLKAAKTVNIAVIDPPSHGATRSDPGGPLSQMLARHGVDVEISVLAKSLPSVSDVLVRHATDMNADMLVMGAYGHSRFRESILGGATRNLLEHTTLPILMAH